MVWGWGWGNPAPEHSHSRAAVTSNGQALLGPHQPLVGDSCSQNKGELVGLPASPAVMALQWPHTGLRASPRTPGMMLGSRAAQLLTDGGCGTRGFKVAGLWQPRGSLALSRHRGSPEGVQAPCSVSSGPLHLCPGSHGLSGQLGLPDAVPPGLSPASALAPN